MTSPEEGHGDLMNSRDGAATNNGGSPTRSGSRYNAVTHGLTAATPVLPNESAEAYQALVNSFKVSLETRNEVENALAEMAAMNYWQIQRANRSEVARWNTHSRPRRRRQILRKDRKRQRWGTGCYLTGAGRLNSMGWKNMTTRSRGPHGRTSPTTLMLRASSSWTLKRRLQASRGS